VILTQRSWFTRSELWMLVEPVFGIPAWMRIAPIVSLRSRNLSVVADPQLTERGLEVASTTDALPERRNRIGRGLDPGSIALPIVFLFRTASRRWWRCWTVSLRRRE
jgi:hypothetical protein